MKIILDRRSCSCWQPACDSHFGWHFLRDEVNPVDCTLEIIDDGRPERVFYIKDRDGLEKELVVNEENRAEAVDSWMELWERQEAEKKNPPA